MKKIILVVLLMLFSFTIDSQTIKLAVPDGFKPISYMDNGKAAGFFTDLATDILVKNGYKVEYYSGTWSECLEGVKSGKYDLVGLIQYALERDKVLDYTHLYVITSWTQIAINKDSKIDTLMDLDGKKIGIMKSDNNAVAFKRYMESFGLNYDEKTFKTYAEIESALAANEITAAPMMGMYRTENPQVKISSIIFNPTQLYFATKEATNKQILTLLDKEIAIQKNDSNSDYNRLIAKYFNQEIEIKILPHWILIILIIICVLAIMVIALRKIILDKTKQLKSARDELEKLNKNLLIRVEEKTEELKNTYEQLYKTEKMASLGSLVSGIAHEINTPLGAIMAATSGVLNVKEFNDIFDFIRDMDDDEFKHVKNVYNQFIRNQNNIDIHNQRLIKQNIKSYLISNGVKIDNITLDMLVDLGITEIDDNLLSTLKSPHASKIENIGSIASVFQMMNLIQQSAEKISKIVSALRIYSHQDDREKKVKMNIYEQIESLLILYYNKMKYSIEIERSYDSNIPEIYCFPDKLNQVFVNLLNNALQAINYKGKITIEVKYKNEEIKISISDNGPGIAEDIKDKMFTPFFTTKKLGEGSGLGLSISKTIVEMHGGRIDFVTSEAGTTFSVYLPIKED
jgi:signal transduction histidine kinase